jgi:hypothetical protein
MCSTRREECLVKWYGTHYRTVPWLALLGGVIHATLAQTPGCKIGEGERESSLIGRAGPLSIPHRLYLQDIAALIRLEGSTRLEDPALYDASHELGCPSW